MSLETGSTSSRVSLSEAETSISEGIEPKGSKNNSNISFQRDDIEQIIENLGKAIDICSISDNSVHHQTTERANSPSAIYSTSFKGILREVKAALRIICNTHTGSL